LIGRAFAWVDLVAMSPGVPVQEIAAADCYGAACGVRNRTVRLGRARADAAAKIIAITGSNGKTTTTALTGPLLNGAGRVGRRLRQHLAVGARCPDGGRMPALAGQVWVLELSSFQLETTHHLNADAATVLNMSARTISTATPAAWPTTPPPRRASSRGAGVMVLNRDDDRSLANGPLRSDDRDLRSRISRRAAVDYGLVDGWIVRVASEREAARAERTEACRPAQCRQRHGGAGLCEASASRRTPCCRRWRFPALPHRVEFVAEIAGVLYFDDSKGTNVGATLAAIRGHGRKVAIILGGDGKGQDFSPLKPALAAHGRAVALIGRDAEAIGGVLAGCGVRPAFAAPTWRLPCAGCAAQAQSGDAVLLSPACASLDMYRNYAHRAEVFIAVRAVKGRAAAC
jgi:UDP-N-acetylmuramoylalanine--D-glutamate ligase